MKLHRQQLYDTLLDTARRYFDRVEEEAGDFQGGVCRIRNESCLLLNRQAKLETKLRIVATALSQLDLDRQFVLPAIRDAIERFAER